MRRTKELRRKLLAGIMVCVMGLGILCGLYMPAFVSHAESQAKVTIGQGAIIRQSASTASARVGGAAKGELLTVLGEAKDEKGIVWYQVQTKDNKTGYVRSDLVELVAGTAPTAEPQTEVTAMTPVNVTVAGETGKIYSNASAESQVSDEVPAGTALTANGYVAGADGKRWYRVSYMIDTAQKEGFILEDEVTAAEADPPASTPEPTEEPKKYETRLIDGEWALIDNSESPAKKWGIEALFNAMTENKKLFDENEKTMKSQKVIIVILIFLVVAAVAGIAFLIFKIRDMMDSAYYSEVENETLRRRGAASGQGGQKVMHTVGSDKQQVRPTGAKPAGSSQGQRPAGSGQSQRPSEGAQGQRPAGSAQPARTAGTPQGQRPAAGSQTPKPGTAQGTSGARAAGSEQGVRASGAAQGTRVVQPSQRTQPKNLTGEDDEFEFEFLKYSEDEEQ